MQQYIRVLAPVPCTKKNARFLNVATEQIGTPYYNQVCCPCNDVFGVKKKLFHGLQNWSTLVGILIFHLCFFKQMLPLACSIKSLKDPSGVQGNHLLLVISIHTKTGCRQVLAKMQR
jgi:hypothetical protein